MTWLTDELQALARRYPPELVDEQLGDVARTEFNVGLVAGRHGPSARVCDVGGGIGLFSLAGAAVGMRVTLVDDFADPVNAAVGPGVLELHRAHGVEVVRRDVIEEGVELEPGAFDAVTSFDSIEHWHHSPRRLLHQLVAALRPGGTLVLGAPNRVNLRKRLTTPLGHNQWSPFEEWYVPERFRGHVREPSVADLRLIAADLKLEQVQILGRNWVGLSHPSPTIRALTSVVDRPLRPHPQLCSDIYLIGRRPQDGGLSAGPQSAAPSR